MAISEVLNGRKRSDIFNNTSQARILRLKKFELDVSKECVDTMFDETINYIFTEKQINSINKKLSK